MWGTRGVCVLRGLLVALLGLAVGLPLDPGGERPEDVREAATDRTAAILAAAVPGGQQLAAAWAQQPRVPAASGSAPGGAGLAPTFSRIVIAPAGPSIFEGEGRPGSRVALLLGGRRMVSGVVDPAGRWRLSIDRPLSAGDHRIEAHADANGGTRSLPGDEVRVAIPVGFAGSSILAFDAERDRPPAAVSRPQAEGDAARHRAEEMAEAASRQFDEIERSLRENRDRVAQSDEGARRAPRSEPVGEAAPGWVEALRAWIERSGEDYRDIVVRQLSREGGEPGGERETRARRPGDASGEDHVGRGSWLDLVLDWLHHANRSYQSEVAARLTRPTGRPPDPQIARQDQPRPPDTEPPQDPRQAARERLFTEEEARRRAEREALMATEQQGRLTQELERRQAEAEALLQRDIEAARQRAEEAARRAAAESEASRRQDEERRVAEEARRRQEELARQAEARRLAAEAVAREQEGAARRAIEQQAAEAKERERRRAEEEAARVAEDTVRRAAEAQRLVEATARREQEERAAHRAEQRRQAAETARLEAERAERLRADEQRRQAEQSAREQAAASQRVPAGEAGTRGEVQAPPGGPSRTAGAAAPDAPAAAQPSATDGRRAEGARSRSPELSAPGVTGEPGSARRPEPASQRAQAVPDGRIAEGSGERGSVGRLARAAPRTSASSRGAVRSQVSKRASRVAAATQCRGRKAGRRTKVPGVYLVARGDTLWGISRRHYSHGRRYPIVYRANRDKIRDPDLIYPCQRLYLPRLRRRG